MTDFNVDNPIIKQFLTLPERVQALEERVEELEKRLEEYRLPVEPHPDK